MSDRIRDGLQASSVAALTGALLFGAVGSSAAQPPVAEPAPVVEVAEEPALTPFPAEDMAAAAAKAKQIEVQRAQRAAQRAQRSSGDMFTPTRNYQLTARFGQPGSWSSGYHTGLDFAAPVGTPVFSALAGTVVEAGWAGAYGNHLVVKHDNGVKTLYAHLSSAKVEVGDKVLRGEHIGAVGNTGNSTGPHLHFEVIKAGDPRNPASFL
jgi:murein DD-endopeptidase MepM/ murein hydrolase activator NlpD